MTRKARTAFASFLARLGRRLTRRLSAPALGLALVATLALLGAAETARSEARIKDLVEFEGVRGNDLVGFGLVVGLDGTGDSLRNSPYTEQALISMLERLGVNVDGERFNAKNVATVLVTATMPPFAREGSRVDVTVSAIGDAKSLMGGTLILTPLNAPDGKIYAVAQGSLLAGGLQAEGDAAEVTTGVPTAATIPDGARIERESGFDMRAMETMRLALRDPDFTTAIRIEEVINNFYGRPIAIMLDSGTIEVKAGPEIARSPAHLISRLENLSVVPAQKARVVIDQRSGTVVLGAEVKISSVAVAQGNLTIRVEERPQVSQPSPFAETGDTVEVPRTDIFVDQNNEANVALLDANVTLSDLVDGLNSLGVGPRGIIDILKAIKAAGALHAELVIQ